MALLPLGTSVPWGPVAISANTDTPTPVGDLDPAANFVTATADLSGVAAGFVWSVIIQYRKSPADGWIDYGGVAGTTTGGPNHDKQGNVTETGVRSGPLPDAGLSGRQIRAVCRLGVSATLSGHIATSA